MSKRQLSVEKHNERFGKPTKASMIRLKGLWLQAAGFPVGASVELTVIAPGVIEIRLNPPVEKLATFFKA